jgi:hypothetical protein
MDDPNLLQRNLEEEAVLGDIIREGGDVVLSFLNDTDGLEGDGEEGSVDRTMEVEEHDYDGSGERTEEGVVAKSGEVYILIKPVLTS